MKNYHKLKQKLLNHWFLPKITIAFDNDEAGQEATRKAFETINNVNNKLIIEKALEIYCGKDETKIDENLINKIYQEQSELKYAKKLTKEEIKEELKISSMIEIDKYYKELEQAHKASLKLHRDDLYKIFGIDEEFAHKARRANLKNQLKKLDNEICDNIKLKYKWQRNKKTPNWLIELKKEEIEEEKKKYYKIKNKIHWLKKPYCPSRQNGQKSFDIERIKQIPIIEILEARGTIIKNEFFKLRDEKTASVKIYQDKNVWNDFGTGDHGDVIDLVMRLDDCEFREACKKLQKYA